MNRRSVSAVVLAGGRSSRFGRDKLAELVGGRTLLDHAVDAVVPLAAEVIVVRRPGDDAAAPSGTRVIHDPVAFQGPLVALQSALAQAIHDTVLVVAGDMPEPARAVLALLIGALDDPAVEAVQLRDAVRPRPLPLVVRREPARSVVDRLVLAGERRLRALPAALRTLVIEDASWRPLDPDGRTLRDVDTPAGLPGD